jgi:hypothetical protein
MADHDNEQPIEASSQQPIPNGYVLVELESRQCWVPKSWVDANGDVKRPQSQQQVGQP